MIEGTMYFVSKFLGSFRQRCVKKKPYLHIFILKSCIFYTQITQLLFQKH